MLKESVYDPIKSYQKIICSYSVKKLQIIILIGSVIISSGLITASATGDLWLDEIWSLNFALNIASAEDIIKIHHDNNHLLNTLYLYIIGNQKNWILYRGLSILTGIASIFLLGYASFRYSIAEAAALLWLAGFSYPLILYFSEARGYAPAIFFSLASFFIIQDYQQEKKLWKIILFRFSAMLGFLSHLTFLYTFVSLILWSFIHEIKSEKSYLAVCREMIKCYAVPIIFIMLLYYLHIRYIVLGGGPIYKIQDVIYETLNMATGIYESGLPDFFGMIVACIILIFGMVILYKEKSESAVFFLSVLLPVPGIILVFRPPKYLYFRYFIICFPFFYMLAAHVLAFFYHKFKIGKAVYAFLLILFFILQIQKIGELVTSGRGDYYNAVMYMAENSTGTDITVGSDHDFRNKLLLEFYAAYLPPGKEIIYSEQSSWLEDKPEWIIMHSQDLSFRPRNKFDTNAGTTYILEQSFRYSGISGWNWFLYRDMLKITKKEDK